VIKNNGNWSGNINSYSELKDSEIK
jgi:hypothetical protein